MRTTVWTRRTTAGAASAVGVLGLLLSGCAVQPQKAAAALPFGPDTCRTGYVWRQVVPADHVCVTPEVRAATRDDNTQAGARRQPGGGAYGPDTCRAGYVWREAVSGDRVCVTTAARQVAQRDNEVAAGRRETGPAACTVTPYGYIGERWRGLGATSGPLGCALIPEYDAGAGARRQRFQHGEIAWSPRQGAAMVVSASAGRGEIDVQWGTTNPFTYSRFLVRWDSNGRNVGQQTVTGYNFPNNRGTTTIPVSPGTYAVSVEGCNKPIIGSSTCSQGWTTPVTVEVTGTAPPRTTPPPATSTPSGLDRLAIYNCVPEHRSLDVWMSDQGTTYRQIGTIGAQYGSGGECPTAGSQPLSVDLEDGHGYVLVLVDQGGDHCGRNDPTVLGCQRQTFSVVGRKGGGTATVVVPTA